MSIQADQVRTFRRTVRNFYKKHGRDLLWRCTEDPYRVLVSEIMLQQTQVQRVTQKYLEFIKAFPTVYVLAQASLADVLRHWSGLGYNRRAKLLKTCAETVVREYGGVFPHTHQELRALPGVGAYTAGAVMAFAFNAPHPIIETNIRTVFMYHFFKDAVAVRDVDILALVTATLDRKHPREWYWALMDYGVHLKKTHKLNQKSAHYTKQSRFEGSNRQIRGQILKILLKEGSLTERALVAQIEGEEDRVKAQIAHLIAEGLLEQSGARIRCAS